GDCCRRTGPVGTSCCAVSKSCKNFGRLTLNAGWLWRQYFSPQFSSCFFFHPLFAISLEELDPNREWKVRALSFSGAESVSSGELEGVLSTQTRPWYTPWSARPPFEPGT